MPAALKRSLSITISLCLLAMPAIAFVKRQDIFDTWQLRQYQASAEIEQISERTTLSEYGKKLFYVHHAQIEEKESFNNHCQGSEQTIVLGCYISRQGIYLYNVTDPRLNGIKEVTAAHEVLHAGYDRLSKSERAKIDAQLDAAFKSLTNDRIKKTVEAYRAKDASVVPNELHSILGTEARNLTPELETYYQRYFTNRGAVVTFSEHYEQAFTERENKVNQYDAELGQIRKQIEANEQTIDSLQGGLESERKRMQDLLAARRYQEYNTAVPAYNARVREYNATVVATQQLIDRFNTIVAERNALAVEENELIKAIDSRPTTIEAQ